MADANDTNKCKANSINDVLLSPAFTGYTADQPAGLTCNAFHYGAGRPGGAGRSAI